MPEQADESATLEEAVERYLVEQGPLTAAELAHLLREAGFDLGADPDDPDGPDDAVEAVEAVEEILDDDTDSGFMPLNDDRWAHLPTLLAGRVLTHRVTADEVDRDLLAVLPDLEPLLIVNDDYADGRFVDGTPVRVEYPRRPGEPSGEHDLPEGLDPHGSVVLPVGTLAVLGVAAGDLVGLRSTLAGLELARVEAVSDDEVIADLGRRAVGLLQERSDEPELIPHLVWTLIADLPRAFVDPLPPLGELLRGWELPVEGDRVGRPGFDLTGWRMRLRLGSLRRRYDLSEDEALTVAAVCGLHESIGDVMQAYSSLQESGRTDELDQLVPDRPVETTDLDPDEAQQRRTVAAVLPFLAEPAVAEAVLAETMTSDGQGAAALGLLAETMEPMADREAWPALRWLQARSLEQLGNTAEAEAQLRASERLDPAWPPTVVDLARSAGDRGDAATGLALLRRVDENSDTLHRSMLRSVLEEYLPRPSRTMPRNQPCWCGSGRKFKQCHLRQADQLPLPERAGWLYQKAVLYVLATSWRERFATLGSLRIQHAESERQATELLHDGLVMDVVLFEGGALEEFAALRGALLPADELLLAEQWLLTERSLFEVTEVRAGAALTVRDVRTGDVTVVRERTASRGLKPGLLICSHLLSTGDGHQLFGGVEPVTLQDREAMIALLDGDPAPYEVIDACSRRLAPPKLANTEGHPLVMCLAVLRSDDPAALAAACDEAYERQPTDTGEESVAEWVATRTVDGLDRIVASLRLDGSELTISTNSEPRLNDALATVRALQPSLQVVSERKDPMRDIRDAARLAETLPASARKASADLSDLPEVREAVAEHMRTYEEQWLDLPIPALAGRTPREAADDPTRRDDLARLLASFPDSDDPTAMSPRRLRDALGLGDLRN